ncbi:serine/threonine-protein kinase Sgk2 [Trichoderma austrokoningii]
MLNETQLEAIRERPLLDSLDAVRAKLDGCTDPPHQGHVKDLLTVLVGSPAAFKLGKKLVLQLASIRENIGDIGSEILQPLLDAVIAKSPDAEVWTAVFNLVQHVGPSTPPSRSTIPTYFGTPVKTSSSRLEDSETRQIVDGELFLEIRDCTHRKVPGFFQRHFDSTRWNEQQREMLSSVLAHHDGTRWKEFPEDPWELPVWNWLISLEEDALLPGATYTLHTTTSAAKFKELKGQVDIFFQRRQTQSSQLTFQDVAVVGEHKRTTNTSEFKSFLLQLARHVHSVFADQPTRRFVHAFTLTGTIMELWVFDRSGPYSSGAFDIHHEPDKLAHALVAYATMEDEAMGLDLTIERTGSQCFISVEDVQGNDRRVELKTLLVRQRAIVCRGTTCYSTEQGVAKFSWRSDKRPSEVGHLKLAHARGVEGVATLVAHREMLSISDLRKGLDFSNDTRHNFRNTRQGQAESYNRPLAGSSGASGKKRKSSEDNGETLPSTIKRRSNSQRSALGHWQTTGNNSRSKPSLYAQDRSEPYENRILSCLVISPAGRVLSDFRSVRELLEGLRDAIKAHRSLYVQGRILHRDISSNNILITDPEKSGGYKGMLIDLDLAKDQDSGPSGARHRTGTMQFMAIEVLRGIDHTYRHDLESFFYVLLWMCARYAWKIMACSSEEEEPAVSKLRQWEIGSFKEIASTKRVYMSSIAGLEEIMDEFPQAVQVTRALCLQIRSVLFGKTEMTFIGTPTGDAAQLYSPIIAAYDESISALL